MASGSGYRQRRRVPQISVHSLSTGMRAQRVVSSSGSGGGGGGGGGGAGGGAGGNALVSFAPHGYSPSPSLLSDIDIQRGLSDWMTPGPGDMSRATTAPSADGSVFRSRVSPNFRQALAEAKERMAARRLHAQSVREQRRSNNHQDSMSRLPDGDRLVEEDDAYDADDVFEETALSMAPPGVEATDGGAAQPPPDPATVSDPRRRRALRRWGLMREIIQDIHRERHAKKAEGWSMFFKHVRAMSEAEKTRQDLYDRYNIFGDGKSHFMSDLPVIPDELLIAAGIPLPASRSRRRAAGLGASQQPRGGRPPGR